ILPTLPKCSGILACPPSVRFQRWSGSTMEAPMLALSSRNGGSPSGWFKSQTRASATPSHIPSPCTISVSTESGDRAAATESARDWSASSCMPDQPPVLPAPGDCRKVSRATAERRVVRDFSSSRAARVGGKRSPSHLPWGTVAMATRALNLAASKLRRIQNPAFWLLALSVGCGSKPDDSVAGSGGNEGVGGTGASTSATGGSAAEGSGGSGTGGTGLPSSGGGTAASGGAMATGGLANTGGASTSGGAAGAGGAPSSGGGGGACDAQG